MNKVIVVIQARMSSTRMPNKVLVSFRDNSTLISRINDLFNHINIPTYLATTEEEADETLSSYASNIGLNVYRGSTDNVLERIVNCANHFGGAEYIVRVCADNPFIIKDYVSELLKIILNTEDNIDYLSYATSNGTPAIKTHYGMFVEIISLQALTSVLHKTNSKSDIEHVSKYIYENPSEYNLMWIPIPKALQEADDIRLTIDDVNDFNTANKIIEHLNNKEPSLPNILKILLEHPGIKNNMKSNIEKYTK